jgi:hypothetical protein
LGLWHLYRGFMLIAITTFLSDTRGYRYKRSSGLRESRSCTSSRSSLLPPESGTWNSRTAFAPREDRARRLFGRINRATTGKKDLVVRPGLLDTGWVNMSGSRGNQEK